MHVLRLCAEPCCLQPADGCRRKGGRVMVTSCCHGCLTLALSVELSMIMSSRLKVARSHHEQATPVTHVLSH